jgi:hypothetical protein
VNERQATRRAAAVASGSAAGRGRRRGVPPAAAAFLTCAFVLLVVACSSAGPLRPPDREPPDPTPPIVYALSLAPAAGVVLGGTEVEFVATVVPAYDGPLAWTTSAGSLVADGLRASVAVPEDPGTLEVAVARAAAPEQRAAATSRSGPG